MATIKAVANLAAVSVGTVSHVITGSVPVSEPLRLRVQSAIRQLDYHPNHVARSLKTSRTRTLGIVVPDLTISFFPQLIRGADTAARSAGYSLIAVNSNDCGDRQKELLSLLRSQRVEGMLLVLASGAPPVTQVLKMREAGIPVVCLDRIPDKLAVDSVCVDDAAAAELGVGHLIARGYRRIAVLTGPATLKNERRRLHGYKQALQRAGIPFDEKLVWRGTFRSQEVAGLCVDRLRDANLRPDSIFATNGPIGLGVLRAIRECGLKTPDDLGLVTFDELTVEDLFTPAVTTVVQPAFEIGSRAAEILLQRLQQQDKAYQPAHIRLPASLKVRDSSRSREFGDLKSMIA